MDFLSVENKGLWGMWLLNYITHQQIKTENMMIGAFSMDIMSAFELTLKAFTLSDSLESCFSHKLVPLMYLLLSHKQVFTCMSNVSLKKWWYNAYRVWASPMLLHITYIPILLTNAFGWSQTETNWQVVEFVRHWPPIFTLYVEIHPHADGKV